MLRQHEELSHNDDKLDKLEPVEVMKTSISQALVVAKNVTVFLFNKINSVQKNSFKVNLFWRDCVGGSSSSLGWLQTRIHGSQLLLNLLSVSGVLQGLYFKYLQHVIRKLHNWQVSYKTFIYYIKNKTLYL